MSKYVDVSVDVTKKRKELGVDENDILILSAGELMTRKNHEVIIEAISLINNPKNKVHNLWNRGSLRFFNKPCN